MLRAYYKLFHIIRDVQVSMVILPPFRCVGFFSLFQMGLFRVIGKRFGTPSSSARRRLLYGAMMFSYGLNLSASEYRAEGLVAKSRYLLPSHIRNSLRYKGSSPTQVNFSAILKFHSKPNCFAFCGRNIEKGYGHPMICRCSPDSTISNWILSPHMLCTLFWMVRAGDRLNPFPNSLMAVYSQVPSYLPPGSCAVRSYGSARSLPAWSICSWVTKIS